MGEITIECGSKPKASGTPLSKRITMSISNCSTDGSCRSITIFRLGGRVETQTFRGANVTRGLAVIGIEGLVPYSYQIDPSIFIVQNGAVSARLAATKDLLMTQRLILQLRFQTNAAVQRVEEFTTGSGLNNAEFGVRLRYDIRRGFSPYVGVSFDRSFGETATLIRQEGGSPSQVRFAMGVRMWF